VKILKPVNRQLARPIETERFILKPMGYFEALRVTGQWRKDPEILAALFQSRKPRSIRKWMRSAVLPNNRNRFTFAILPRETGIAIGAEIVSLSGYRSAYLTVALHDRDWWGKGVIVETRSKLIGHFFRHGDVERFFGTVEGRNLSSIFNYQRLGFKNVGAWHRHRQDPVSGEVYDLLHFEIFRDEWEAGPFAEASDER
jgi:RimJ/RimL family protein N-acetyltransferase